MTVSGARIQFKSPLDMLSMRWSFRTIFFFFSFFLVLGWEGFSTKCICWVQYLIWKCPYVRSLTLRAHFYSAVKWVAFSKRLQLLMTFIVARLYFLIKPKCQAPPQMGELESFNIAHDSKHRYRHQAWRATGTTIWEQVSAANKELLKSHIINLEISQLGSKILKAVDLKVL